ncbi:hypothetical protein NMY22_g5371 [Coprinellus aureogranulatus]|nr:hypothetical protein NMY22_g5371 [Coprinellus aureogranulatus]
MEAVQPPFSQPVRTLDDAGTEEALQMPADFGSIPTISFVNPVSYLTYMLLRGYSQTLLDGRVMYENVQGILNDMTLDSSPPPDPFREHQADMTAGHASGSVYLTVPAEHTHRFTYMNTRAGWVRPQALSFGRRWVEVGLHSVRRRNLLVPVIIRFANGSLGAQHPTEQLEDWLNRRVSELSTTRWDTPSYDRQTETNLSGLPPTFGLNDSVHGLSRIPHLGIDFWGALLGGISTTTLLYDADEPLSMPPFQVFPSAAVTIVLFIIDDNCFTTTAIVTFDDPVPSNSDVRSDQTTGAYMTNPWSKYGHYVVVDCLIFPPLDAFNVNALTDLDLFEAYAVGQDVVTMLQQSIDRTLEHTRMVARSIRTTERLRAALEVMEERELTNTAARELSTARTSP